MIILDTHIWIWWTCSQDGLSTANRKRLEEIQNNTLKISQISIWEVAKLVEKGRLKFSIPVCDWIGIAISNYNIEVIPLSTQIILDSTSLPGIFHSDPADQIIVSTSRILNLPVMTQDKRILDYAFVEKF